MWSYRTVIEKVIEKTKGYWYPSALQTKDEPIFKPDQPRAEP
ncbi:20918_t:CDS:1, partial [Gigaspora margarita]